MTQPGETFREMMIGEAVYDPEITGAFAHSADVLRNPDPAVDVTDHFFKLARPALEGYDLANSTDSDEVLTTYFVNAINAINKDASVE